MSGPRPGSGANSALRRTVDDDEVGIGAGLTDGLGALVFGALVARQRGGAVGELDHDIALTRLALHGLESATAHEEFRPEFLKCRTRRGEVFGITLLVADRDAHDPIGFRHGYSPLLMVDVYRRRSII